MRFGSRDVSLHVKGQSLRIRPVSYSCPASAEASDATWGINIDRAGQMLWAAGPWPKHGSYVGFRVFGFQDPRSVGFCRIDGDSRPSKYGTRSSHVKEGRG
jgi:hypothetical protein